MSIFEQIVTQIATAMGYDIYIYAGVNVVRVGLMDTANGTVVKEGRGSTREDAFGQIAAFSMDLVVPMATEPEMAYAAA